MKLIRPIRRRITQKRIGASMFPNLSARRGDAERTANTPRRAIAISRPIARAISLPSNHFAIAFDTVIPAISQPHPKIMKPREAIFALPGRAVHHEPSQLQNSVAWNQSVMPMYLIPAPITMSEVERIPVKRTPILSRMIPARMRNPQTLRMYSEAAYVPKTELSQPLADSTSD